MLRFFLWRLLGVSAVFVGVLAGNWLLGGGPGLALRGAGPPHDLGHLVSPLADATREALRSAPSWASSSRAWPVHLLGLAGTLLIALRWRTRHRRVYVRLPVEAYRTDCASVEALVAMIETLHKRLLRRWWLRLLTGQASVALEVHHDQPGRGAPGVCRLAITCPAGLEGMAETALQAAYPNSRIGTPMSPLEIPPVLLRLKKQAGFISRVKSLERFEHERAPAVNRLMTVMAACASPSLVQISLTPVPSSFDRISKALFRHREAELERERTVRRRSRSMLDDAELRGGLDVQHRPLFFADIRVAAPDRTACERIASELRAESAENRLVERGTALRHGLLGLYARRLQRGEGNPLASLWKGVFASTELAGCWQVPSIDFMTVPFARSATPIAPAPPGIFRPAQGEGTLRDALGAVSIHPEMRRQNTAVPGTVEQGKTSFLVASVAEDLARDHCAVILLDPKGDAAEAALSLVPLGRTCTLLDFSHPTCGFNPLAVDAPADVIADYVVGALKNLFTDADIRASSDRYLRNAIIAVLAYDRRATLWDAARLLSVGEEGYSYRRSVGARVRALPEYKEISQFFTAELAAQLADARSVTTAKLDAPVNKLARLLNSPSIKRVLLNDSLRVDLDHVIGGEEVLVVRGALGAMGAGNTSVLMQLLVGMMDAALARQQDLVPAERRVAVALKIDEAPLVLNRGFAETLALKRSAGLETVACWQTDAQWTDREVRDQLDALFAHRVYFATASARDARDSVALTMAAFSDTVRPGISHLSSLGHPDVRLHLPKHHAIASWSTAAGRQAPFLARTIPLHVDRERLAQHQARQLERGGRHLTDLRQPHWETVKVAASDSEEPMRGAAASRRPRDTAGGTPDLPAAPAESYGELVELDRAQSVRRTRRVDPPSELKIDPLDLEILAFVAVLRHVLTSQLHRRFSPSRSVTTMQRRLKRLSDAGYLERFQFHRRDGGGVPMCCVISAEGLDALARDGGREQWSGARQGNSELNRASTGSKGRLRDARRDIHLAGWVVALECLAGAGRASLRGADEAVLSPALRSPGEARMALGPADLRLPGGRTPHDFLRTSAAGRVEVERFETLRPGAIVELPGGHERVSNPAAGRPARGDGAGGLAETTIPGKVDLLVEFDDLSPARRGVAKLERYDHMLSGWACHVPRYGSRAEAVPVAVFICRDRSRARDCARLADGVLGACRAYAGEYPVDWEYTGRERILFAPERDVHEGSLCAYGVPPLPPTVRVGAAHNDPRAGEAVAHRLDIPVALPAQARVAHGAPGDD